MIKKWKVLLLRIKGAYYLHGVKLVLKHSNWNGFLEEKSWHSLTSLGSPHLSNIHSRKPKLYSSFNLSDNSFSIFVGFIFPTDSWFTKSWKKMKLIIRYTNLIYKKNYTYMILLRFKKLWKYRYFLFLKE